jgi:cardiolipin synthase
VTATGSTETDEGMFDRIWTLPNLVTLIRLLCLPLFLYLLFGVENRVAAAVLLGGLGATDWVDGYLARRLDQTSEFGRVFDPTVDRILFIVALTAIVIDGSIPVWFAVAVLAREILVGAMMVVATVFLGVEPVAVTWWGKTATFLLMFAVPSFLLGASDLGWAGMFQFLGYALGIPGLLLSVWTGFAYIPMVRAGLAESRAPTSTIT